MSVIPTCDCTPVSRIFTYGRADNKYGDTGVDYRKRVYNEEYKDDQTISDFSFPYCDSIGAEAFRSSSIKTIDVPKCVTIGDYAFSGSQLRYANFSSVKEIGSYAFWSLPGASAANSTLSFPSLEYIGDYAFGQNGAYTSANYTLDVNWEGVKEIGAYAFEFTRFTYTTDTLNLLNCEKIEDGAWTSPGDSRGYAYFKAINIPKTKTLGESVFQCVRRGNYDVDAITVKIGPYCEAFGGGGSYGSFIGDTYDLYIEATTPPTHGGWGYDGLRPRHIYVPAASVTAYQNASVWSSCASIIEPIPTEG